MPTIVLADGVCKRLGTTRALGGVSLALGHGITGLLGPNGAGKTTLMRILATVLRPDAGQIRIFGREPADPAARPDIRRRPGYMPQEPGFHQRFTAFEFVDYVAILKELTERRARHDEVRRVLGLVGLDDVMHKRIKALSGGMRRRVIIAQALLGDPRLLVLDEPTGGLDPEQRLRFRELVSVFAERHTLVLATHQTEDVAALCQKVVVIDRGGVLFDGTPAALAALAQGQVWLADAADPDAKLSWRTATGQHRVIGHQPPGAVAAVPTIEDGYLLLLGQAPDALDAASATSSG